MSSGNSGSSKEQIRDPVLGFYRKRHNTPKEKQVHAPQAVDAAKAEDPLQNPMGTRGSWTSAIMNTMSFGSRSSVVSDAQGPTDGAPNLARRASQDEDYEDDVCIYGF
jgi:hypothetical protein